MQSAAVVAKTEPVLDSVKPLDVLNYIATLNDLSFDDWKKEESSEGPALSYTDTESSECVDPARENCPEASAFKHSYSIQLSGKSSSKNSGDNKTSNLYAAIIQLAEQENPAPDYPEKDMYECQLLVMKFENNKWAQEFYGSMFKDEYTGGTRFAKSCKGFSLAWDVQDHPVFTRTRVVGPYAGGKYVSAKEFILFENGKYIYKVDSNESEDTLDEESQNATPDEINPEEAIPEEVNPNSETAN